MNESSDQGATGVSVRLVDAAVSVYGKPFQTLVSMLTLARNSGDHLGTLYCIEEAKQPFGEQIEFIYPIIRRETGLPIERFRPSRFLGCSGGARVLLDDEEYRLSIRYQYAFERAAARYLFVFHNDMRFDFDVVSQMLAELWADGFAGVGPIGQCWNCPGRVMGCTPDGYLNFQPSYEATLKVVGEHFVRTLPGMIDQKRPAPLPECRLNEFACLIDLDLTSWHVTPKGPVEPFGFFTIDCGERWFRGLTDRGLRFKHYDKHMHGHAWAARIQNLPPCGHDALFDRRRYVAGEALARQWLIEALKIRDLPPALE